jgi:hypothetical protein
MVLDLFELPEGGAGEVLVEGMAHPRGCSGLAAHARWGGMLLSGREFLSVFEDDEDDTVQQKLTWLKSGIN